jgi:hypothetical protein
MINFKSPNQADVPIIIAALKGEIDATVRELHPKVGFGHIPQAPDLKGKNSLEQMDALAAYSGKLKAMLKLSSEDVTNARNSATTPTAVVAQPAQTTTTKIFNPDALIAAHRTQQPGNDNNDKPSDDKSSEKGRAENFDPDSALLAVRGVKNLAELNAVGATAQASAD